MLRKVYLHGRFQQSSEPILIEAITAADVVEAVSRQLPSFRPSPRSGLARIKVVGFNTRESLFQDLGDKTELHIIPQLNGGKSGNSWVQIAIGVALVGVGLALATVNPFLSSMAIKIGAMALLGGIAQLLAPQPEADNANSSKYLGAPQNTVKIGTRIPILYGRFRVYGQILSFDINAQEFVGSGTASGTGGK